MLLDVSLEVVLHGELGAALVADEGPEPQVGAHVLLQQVLPKVRLTHKGIIKILLFYSRFFVSRWQCSRIHRIHMFLALPDPVMIKIIAQKSSYASKRQRKYRKTFCKIHRGDR